MRGAVGESLPMAPIKNSRKKTLRYDNASISNTPQTRYKTGEIGEKEALPISETNKKSGEQNGSFVYLKRGGSNDTASLQARK